MSGTGAAQIFGSETSRPEPTRDTLMSQIK
jgi:hypothetical protein